VIKCHILLKYNVDFISFPYGEKLNNTGGGAGRVRAKTLEEPAAEAVARICSYIKFYFTLKVSDVLKFIAPGNIYSTSSDRHFFTRLLWRRIYDFIYREKWYSGLTGPGSRWKAVLSCEEIKET